MGALSITFHIHIHLWEWVRIYKQAWVSSDTGHRCAVPVAVMCPWCRIPMTIRQGWDLWAAVWCQNGRGERSIHPPPVPGLPFYRFGRHISPKCGASLPPVFQIEAPHQDTVHLQSLVMHSAVMVFYFKPHVGVGIIKTGKVLLKGKSEQPRRRNNMMDTENI